MRAYAPVNCLMRERYLDAFLVKPILNPLAQFTRYLPLSQWPANAKHLDRDLRIVERVQAQNLWRVDDLLCPVVLSRKLHPDIVQDLKHMIHILFVSNAHVEIDSGPELGVVGGHADLAVRHHVNFAI